MNAPVTHGSPEASGGIAPRTGGQLIVDALVANGVKRLSCVPG